MDMSIVVSKSLFVSWRYSQGQVVCGWGPYRLILVHETPSSPPRSMPKPSTLPILERSIPMWGLSLVGGRRLSKFSRRRASRAAAGVFAPAGVRVQDPPICAGLGVMFKNSAKLRFADGVLRPKPGNGAPPPPGVDIMEDGRGVDLGGGVEGAMMRGLLDAGCAGDGDVAKYMRRLASSSPVCPSRAAAAAVNPLWRRRADRATAGGGVRGARGGDDRT